MAVTMARRHILYDVWTDELDLLKWIAPWQTLLPEIARDSGARVIGQQFHQFAPWGVTGFVLLAESHISLHTWPEHGFAALDIFTCGDMDVDLVVQQLRTYLKPFREQVRQLARGDENFINGVDGG